MRWLAAILYPLIILGGFWIIRADSPDAAQAWAVKASEATGLPIEVRAFQS